MWELGACCTKGSTRLLRQVLQTPIGSNSRANMRGASRIRSFGVAELCHADAWVVPHSSRLSPHHVLPWRAPSKKRLGLDAQSATLLLPGPVRLERLGALLFIAKHPNQHSRRVKCIFSLGLGSHQPFSPGSPPPLTFQPHGRTLLSEHQDDGLLTQGGTCSRTLESTGQAMARS
jgi:hypothetical protein